MGEERKVCELIPAWEHVEAGVLYGTVQVYADFIVDGVTYQADPEVGIAFYRDGDTPDRCFGTVFLWARRHEDRFEPLEGWIAMLYGVEGAELRQVPKRITVPSDPGYLCSLWASGFDTDGCDDIFMNAGGLSWGEVFEQVKAEPVTTEETPPPDNAPPPVDGRTPPPLPGE